MKTLKTLKAQLLANPDTSAAYDAMTDEFGMARELIAAHRPPPEPASCDVKFTASMFEVQTYLSPDGQDPYAQWLAALADRQARARVLVRVGRMAAGNFGDCKPVGEGVWELRIDWGPGYRVYYAQAGKRLVLLLAGGDKRTQQADITAALAHWHDWQQRRKPV